MSIAALPEPDGQPSNYSRFPWTRWRPAAWLIEGQLRENGMTVGNRFHSRLTIRIGKFLDKTGSMSNPNRGVCSLAAKRAFAFVTVLTRLLARRHGLYFSRNSRLRAVTDESTLTRRSACTGCGDSASQRHGGKC